MSDYVFDTEFLDKDDVLTGISIGIVCVQDGREFYGINAAMPQAQVSTGWLGDNVWPHLPVRNDELDFAHSAVMSPHDMRAGLDEFFGETLGPDDPCNRLWAWYGAFDFVVLARFAGGFLGLGTPIPQYLWGDLRALWDITAPDERPPYRPLSAEYAHHPLHDARWAVELGIGLGAFERA